MRDAGGGSIINISSLAAVYGLPFALHYAVSKAAVIGMTRSLARELGRDWIRVNSIAPSAVMTEGTEEFFGPKLEKAKDVIASGQTLQRNLETGDLSGTVVYLASDASKFVTGQTSDGRWRNRNALTKYIVIGNTNELLTIEPLMLLSRPPHEERKLRTGKNEGRSGMTEADKSIRWRMMIALRLHPAS